MDWTLAERYPRRHLPAGTVLFHEGDLGSSMYFVVEGNLQVSKRLIEGADKVLSTLGAGQYVGEMSLLTGAKRSATVQALADSDVIEIDQQGFVELLHDQPQVGLDLMRQMARRLEETNEELVLLALEVALAQRAPQRLVSGARRMRFVATGSFTEAHAPEVMQKVSEHAAQPPNPALITRLWVPGRTRQALVYVIETDNPRDFLDLIAPFGGLVQWDIVPALEIDETLTTPSDDEPSPRLLP